MGETMQTVCTMGVRDPSPECRIRITLPTGHIQVPTRHGDKRRTEPSRHRAATRLLALPPTVAQVDGGPGRTSPSTEGRGSRDRLCLYRYPVRAGRCPLTHKPFWWLE